MSKPVTQNKTKRKSVANFASCDMFIVISAFLSKNSTFYGRIWQLLNYIFNNKWYVKYNNFFVFKKNFLHGYTFERKETALGFTDLEENFTLFLNNTLLY